MESKLQGAQRQYAHWHAKLEAAVADVGRALEASLQDTSGRLNRSLDGTRQQQAQGHDVRGGDCDAGVGFGEIYSASTSHVLL